MQEAAKASGAKLSMTDCRDLDDQRMTMLFVLEGETIALQEAMRRLRRSKDITQLHETEVSKNKVLCLGVVKRPVLCTASRGLGLVCIRCPYSDVGEKMPWEILVRRSGDIHTLMNRLTELGVDAKLTSISQYDHEERLTIRQKEIIAAALSQGYFDFPRKVGLTELSKRLGIKASTLSEILRSAERKVMQDVTAVMASN